VKTDTKRFPRARLRRAGGELAIGDVLSIFHAEAQKADAKAFARLLAHLKEVDEKHSTVIMVQVENETGLLGDSRDGGAAAEKRFNSAVPAELTEALTADKDLLREELSWAVERVGKNSTGTWPEVFGRNRRTDELFMAYHYALYLEQVASAGKQAYPIPMYTHVWQNYNDDDADNNFPVVVGGGDNPGDYPSGGGVINVLDVWKAFAPSLDMISPDVYLNDYSSSCAKYRHREQPLFIPEQRRDEYGARRVWVAIGSYQCLGTAPFGIDTLEPHNNPFKRHYGLMKQVSKQILEAQRNLSSVGFFFDELPAGPDAKDPSPAQKVTFGPWRLTIERSFVFGHAGPGFGMIVH
jgi:beta-galactosidase GanA